VRGENEHERPLRERKKRRTRLAIHDAAQRLVEANGLEATTVESICELAEVSPRTFFNYFPSKAAATLGLPEAVISAAAVERYRAARGPLVPALCRLLAESADGEVDHLAAKRLMLAVPELGPAFTQWMSAVRAEFVALAQERADSPERGTAAVALVMGALSLSVHDPAQTRAPGAEQLMAAVDRLAAAHGAMLAERD